MTSAAPAHLMSSLTVVSDLLGTVAVSQSQVLDFPQGLLGFPECRSFVLLQSERDNAYWLQSVEYSSLVFLTIDPFPFFPGYSVDLAAADITASRTSADDLTVLAIVTLPRGSGESATANLQGPVIIDTRLSHGHQVVIPDGQYGIREPVEL